MSAKPMPAKIVSLFAQTKVLCFGRYAIRVPMEAKIDFGECEVYTAFKTYPGQAAQADSIIKKKWQGIYEKSAKYGKPPSAVLIKRLTGSVTGGQCIWYYESDLAVKDKGAQIFGIFPMGSNAYSFYGWGEVEDGSLQKETDKLFTFIRNFRVRDNYEAPPPEQGYCINLGFIREESYQYQETAAAGIYLPSLPDVRFSVYSNKGASTTNGNEVGVIGQIEEARKAPGRYPYKTLRMGKRPLHGLWQGEEALLLGDDGAYRFTWTQVGKQTTAQPGQMEVELYSKVAADRVGAADTSSVTEEEAIALYDAYLSGFKFRVAVPGAPADAVMLP